MKKISIAIAGGGFCGTMVLYHLMQRDDLPPLQIDLYDEAGRHGRGVAYSTPFPEHLLNVPASGMSARPDVPDDFIRFLGPDANPAGFYPRMIYGDYLSGFLSQARDLAAQRGHDVKLHTACAPTNDHDITILSTGTSQPVLPAGEGAIDHPYGDAFSSRLKNHQSIGEVIILGTGLSAADAVVSLYKAGYQGHITCVSRHGLWPVVHGPKKYLWHWRKYVDGLRPYSNKIWRALPKSAHQFFLKRITYWNAVRHRMPPECYAVLETLRHAGQLTTIKGHVCAVKINDQKIEIHLRHNVITGDVAVNCLGFIPYLQTPVGGFRVSDHMWTLGAPLFGHLIETTAVPELRIQAEIVAKDVADYIKRMT